MIKEGEKAPDFRLPDETGKVYTLADFKNKKAVLYFYPKDNTPGCTRQACAFRDSIKKFREIDVLVVGISKDPTVAHRRFIEEYQLPFLLLSDEKMEAINAYGVWVEKTSYGKTAMGVSRTTFLINEEGIIEKVFPNVNPDTNAAEVLAYLETKKSA